MIRRLCFLQFICYLAFESISPLSAQVTPSHMSSTTQGTSEIQGSTLKPLERPQPINVPKPALPAPVKPVPQVPQFAEYLHPGILVNVNGAWEGSDHLLNLTNNIGVYVRILKLENEALEVNEKDLQKHVETIFDTGGIRPLTLAPAGKPPLPAFEVEIFVYPIERGYVAFLAGRLFESVVLDRFKMDPNMAFQAITWEKQSLIVSPKENFAEQLTKALEDIAGAFVARFQTFERLKRGMGR